MRFLARLLAYLSDLKARGREVLVCGDFNIAHQAIDLARPSANEHTSGYLPEERRWMDDLLAEGYVDTYRALVGPEPGHYTWWYNFKAARPKNLGWRLDYQIATPATAARAKRATIDRSVLFSDHAPVTIDYEMNERPPASLSK
jgi:exodeoxyribonuclease-3